MTLRESLTAYVLELNDTIVERSERSQKKWREIIDHGAIPGTAQIIKLKIEYNQESAIVEELRGVYLGLMKIVNNKELR